MAARTSAKRNSAQAKTDRSRLSFAQRNEDTTLKYQPTPRDLFNPPPQAIVFGNLHTIAEIQDAINEQFPDYYDPARHLFEKLLYVIAGHEVLIGVKE